MASLVIKIIIIQIVIRSIEDHASLDTIGKNLSEKNSLTDYAQCFKFTQNVSFAFLRQKLSNVLLLASLSNETVLSDFQTLW